MNKNDRMALNVIANIIFEYRKNGHIARDMLLYNGSLIEHVLLNIAAQGQSATVASEPLPCPRCKISLTYDEQAWFCISCGVFWPNSTRYTDAELKSIGNRLANIIENLPTKEDEYE